MKEGLVSIIFCGVAVVLWQFSLSTWWFALLLFLVGVIGVLWSVCRRL